MGPNLGNLRDNVTAGGVLLRELTRSAPQRTSAHRHRRLLPGLAGVREHGMSADTKRYVANVIALKTAFERGNYPA